MPVLAPNNGARRQRREGKRAAALKFMDKVEPLVAELIQCADTTLALRNDTDVAEAMLRFLRQRERRVGALNQLGHEGLDLVHKF